MSESKFAYDHIATAKASIAPTISNASGALVKTLKPPIRARLYVLSVKLKYDSGATR